MNLLTRKEELILLAVLRLGKSASLVKIREHLVNSTGQNWSVGNVYVPLDRMSRIDLREKIAVSPFLWLTLSCVSG